MAENKDFSAKFVDLPPEILLVTREADYVATPTLRHEPITGGVHVTNVRLDRVENDSKTEK